MMAAKRDNHSRTEINGARLVSGAPMVTRAEFVGYGGMKLGLPRGFCRKRFEELRSAEWRVDGTLVQDWRKHLEEVGHAQAKPDRPPPGKEKGRWRGTNDPKSNQQDCFNDEETLSSGNGCVKSSSTGITGLATRSSGANLGGDVVPTSEKITDYTPKRRKSPTTHSKKSPTTHSRKSPTNYVPGALVVVVGREELEVLLKKQGQGEWCTEVRVGGLLLVLHYILLRHRSRGTRISGGLARDLVSARKKPKRESTIQQPLAVLEEIGLLTKLREAIFTPHVKDCALYVIPPEILAKKRQEEVLLSPSQIRKLENAEARKEKRLNKRWSWKEPLMEVLRGSISLSAKGHKMALDLVCDGRKEDVTKRMNRFLRKPEELARAWADVSDQIFSNVCWFPKELKQELLLDGEPVAVCDISHAHHDLLTILLINRVVHLEGLDVSEGVLQSYRDEMERLREFLSDGDYYRKWCIDELDDNERDEKKNLLTMILNWRNSEAENNGLYRRMKSKFPWTFQIVEDLKRKDHRVLGIQLRHYMAEVINPALLELQAKGIKSIPDCDAIIVPARFKEVACEAIGRAMYKLTGVCCNVDKVRYQPPANGQHAAA